MRVSSVLEAGTVSGELIHTNSFVDLISALSCNWSGFTTPTGMGKSVQSFVQQCSIRRKEAIWHWYVFNGAGLLGILILRKILQAENSVVMPLMSTLP